MSVLLTQPAHQIVYERWHKAINAQNIDDLMDLYADDATIDSAAVLVFEKDPSGILKGKQKLRSHFLAFFALIGPSDGSEWFRYPMALSCDNTLLWEYPSAGAYREQLDVVESFDIHDGLITHHRVYWGRVGFKLLASQLPEKESPKSHGWSS